MEAKNVKSDWMVIGRSVTSGNIKKNIHLYDLENDPYENINIFENKPDMIKKMEKILQRMQENIVGLNNDISEEEEKKISEELKKLGYL